METRAQLETEFLNRAMVANNSNQFPPDRVTQLIKDASRWAGTIFFWPPLYRSRYFSSKPNSQSATPILPLNYDYYDYPTDFLTGSVSRLYFGGIKYEKKAFQDFLDYVDHPNQNDIPPNNSNKIFSEFGRQFFVYPGVTTAGTNDGLVWGNIQPPDLANASDKTIFSLWNDAGNEAIVKKALSVAFERLDGSFANEQETKAISLLQVIWGKVVAEEQRKQRLGHPQFTVPDLFGSGGSTIGNFNIPNGIDIIT